MREKWTDCNEKEMRLYKLGIDVYLLFRHSHRCDKWRRCTSQRLTHEAYTDSGLSPIVYICKCNYLAYNTSLYTRENKKKETVRQTRRDRDRTRKIIQRKRPRKKGRPKEKNIKQIYIYIYIQGFPKL